MSDSPSQPQRDEEQPESREDFKIGPGLWLAGLLMLLGGIALGIFSATRALSP
jgi:hypothetical protein